MTTLKDIGEIEAIRRLGSFLPSRADIRVGAGDDCAVLRISDDAPHDLLLTSDPVIEGTHFTPDTPRHQVGHKAAARAISDIAAMGGIPLWTLVDVVAPPHTPFADIEKTYEGFRDTAGKHGLALVGGDLSQGEVLELHVFAVGRVPSGDAILRSGATPGHAIFVTGELGGSAAGRHLSFQPRVTEGAWLREQSWAAAMIDVSDGLATDLRHLINASDVGAEIDTARVPISDEAAALHDGQSPLDHALRDGEDFELLFTVPGEKADALETAWAAQHEIQCTRIGRITSDTGALQAVDASCRRSLIVDGGFDHFA
ncbi:MAG: thiamine-phosphate kinase [Lentisphaerae bacterium]|nr:thiamine-phosphate kinase [Lentisphaerota bacterium]